MTLSDAPISYGSRKFGLRRVESIALQGEALKQIIRVRKEDVECISQLFN